MLELVGLISQKFRIPPKQDDFEGMLVEDIVISAPAGTVFQLLLDVNAWSGLLPYVHDVNLTYDDGQYQEVVLDLDSGAGDIVSVRSVRRYQFGHIAYFLPQPAYFLKHHCGDWLIETLSEHVTQLTAIQRWTRSKKAAAAFPSCGGMTSEQHVCDVLREHVRIALEVLKNSLECNAPISGAASLRREHDSVVL